MLRGLKDKGVSLTLTALINNKIERLGKMLELKIDSTNKRLYVEVDLKGEKEPLKVEIGRYDIIEEDERAYIEAYDITTSREWLTEVAKRFIEGKSFEIPKDYVKVLKMIV